MEILDWLLNLFFPPRCASCKKEGDFLCENCLTKIKVIPIRACSAQPSKLDFKHLDGVIYGVDYSRNPVLKPAIFQFKYKFTQQLCEQFSDLILKKISELKMIQGKNIVLIPVPLHKKRLAYRGFNQSQILAEAIQRKSENPIQVLPLLERSKNTSQQAKLHKKERNKNLEDAFRLHMNLPDLQNSVCFLVDDVCTTGSTLEACAQILKEAGLKKVYGLVVARAFR